MHRIDGPTRSATLPPPSAAGTGNASPGYFGHGDPIARVAPTTLDVDWANAVQEEIAGVVEGAGLALDKANQTQLLAALRLLFVAKGGGADFYLGPNGEFSIPLGGGFILKGGSTTGSYSEGQIAVNFNTAFPNGCLIAIPVAINASGNDRRDVWAQRVSRSAAGFVAMIQWTGQNTNSSDGIDWFAVGY